MKETTQLIIFAAAVTLVAFLGYTLTTALPYTGDLFVEQYTAELFTDGRLIETYRYNVQTSRKYTMLYRYWNDDVTFDEDLTTPYFRVTDVQCPYIGYIKNYQGAVWVQPPNSYYESRISSKAYDNEIGCFNPDYYQKGTYNLTITYQIAPPVEYDNQYYHVNVNFADNHVPYNTVEIIIHDPKQTIVQLFTHPPMTIAHTNDAYILTGSSPENSLLEVEFISSDITYGIQSYVDNVLDKTLSANNAYSLSSSTISLLNSMLLVLTLGFAGLMLLLYAWKGRERPFVVPEYLNFIPQKRKPWVVNLVFHRSSVDFSEHGFYATLLNLHNRNIITIKERNTSNDLKFHGVAQSLLEGLSKGDYVEIILHKTTDHLDAYEQRVIDFLRKWSVDDVFSSAVMLQKVSAMRHSPSSARRLNSEMMYLLHRAEKSAADPFMINGRILPGILLAGGVLLMAFSYLAYQSYGFIYPSLSMTLASFFIFSIQAAIMTAATPTLFGRWRENYYKEKLEWDSFRRFLKNMAQLEKYSLQDILIWKEWLAYGTALGIGKDIARAMQKLNIRLPEATAVPVMFVSFHAIHQSTMAAQGGGSHGGHGGGFGGGGGHGGGGAGGR